jgi:hypothetical protein
MPTVPPRIHTPHVLPARDPLASSCDAGSQQSVRKYPGTKERRQPRRKRYVERFVMLRSISARCSLTRLSDSSSWAFVFR